MTMKYLKTLVDFESAYLDKNFNYHIWGLKKEYKKGDTLYLDMCIFDNSHTYIKAKVLKSYKNKIVVSYNYIEEE